MLRSVSFNELVIKQINWFDSGGMMPPPVGAFSVFSCDKLSPKTLAGGKEGRNTRRARPAGKGLSRVSRALIFFKKS